MRKLRLKNGLLCTIERGVEIGCPVAKPEYHELEGDYWSNCNEYCSWFNTQEVKVYDGRTMPSIVTYACCKEFKMGELVEVDE